MTRIITAFTVLTVALGTAAFAGTTAPAASASGHQPAPASLTYSSRNTTYRPASMAMNPTVPGATGSTIVPGDNSTIAGDAKATQMERTGSYGAD